jgi:peptide/nickel transport system substrate-binding protein
VTTQGDYDVTITLKAPNSAFLDYLACPYGPRIMSPEGLKKNAGSDNAQTYLTNHDLGTGPYMLTDAQVGSHYAMAAFGDYWGAKPYFEKVEMPVVTDVSAQQLQFNNGQLAAILHDLPSSAVGQYLNDSKYSHYSLPTMMSNYIYINPRKGMMTDAKNRNAVMQAVDRDELVKQTYFGRGEVADQIYPSNMMAAEFGKQSVPHDASVLTALAAGLPPDQKTVTIGYDSSNPDNQLITNLVQTQLAAAGLNAKVQAYPTSEIYGWIGNDAPAAPEIMAYLGWPDAPSPYTWGHISWDADGGLNLFGCSAPPVTAALAKGLPAGSDADYSTAGVEAVKTGCWLNIANVNDFMVAQPWLKGVEQAHVVTNPNTLRVAALSAG